MKKRAFFSCVIAVCIAVFVGFSNPIVAHFSGPHFERYKGSVDVLEKDYVMCDLEEIEVDKQSLLECVRFSGWAYCPTKLDNSNKKIGIVFLNDEHFYIYTASPSVNRWDVLAANFVPSPPGETLGLWFSASTLLVADGTYDVYIYCKENEENYGLEQTQYAVTKRGREIFLSEWTSEACPMVELSDLQYDAKMSIESNEVGDDGILMLKGWAFLPELFSGDQNVIVCLEYEDGDTAFFRTRRTRRQDVANYFDNPLYSTSGFEARIPIEKLLPKPYDVTILVENEGVIHMSSTGENKS